MAKSGSNFIGSWAFLIGVILAVVLGFMNALNQTWLYILVVIGLVVGFLNIAERETTPFLMSGVILIIVATFGQSTLDIIPAFDNILQALLVIFVPATIIVAVKHVFMLARR